MTWLACFESLMATVVVGYTVFVLGNSDYLLFAIGVAPLLLLQSEDSKHVAAAIFARLKKLFDASIVGTALPGLALLIALFVGVTSAIELLDDYPDDYLRALAGFVVWTLIAMLVLVPALLAVWVVIVAIVSLLIRVVSVAAGCVISPGVSILAIPVNWSAVCFKTDLRHVPELFPGSEGHGSFKLRRYFADLHESFLQMFGHRRDLPKGGMAATTFLLRTGWIIAQASSYAGAVFVFVVLFVAATAYRFCLKGTFVVFLPFFYFADTALTKKDRKEFLEAIRDSVIAKRMAWFVLISHIALPIVTAFLFGAFKIEVPNGSLLSALLDYWSFRAPLSANSLGKIVNALLVFSSAGFAAWVLSRKTEAGGISLGGMVAGLRVIVVLRAFLTIYSIIYVAVLVSYHVSADQVRGGLEAVVEWIRNIDVDWAPLPKKPLSPG